MIAIEAKYHVKYPVAFYRAAAQRSKKFDTAHQDHDGNLESSMQLHLPPRYHT